MKRVREKAVQTLDKLLNFVDCLRAMLTCILALADKVVPVVGWTSNQKLCFSWEGISPSSWLVTASSAPSK